MTSSAADRYATAIAGQGGSVKIVTEGGRRITPSRDHEQVGADQVTVAPDHQSVGWLALYPNCCTSYPIPLKLVILHNGHLRYLKGAYREPIWWWAFQDGGRQVAFEEETPHGSMGLHYELWNVASGKRVTDYTPEYDENGHVIARPREPKWVQALDAVRGNRH